MRAILIDAVNQRIEEVDAKGLQDYYRLLGVEVIELATTLDNNDVIYVDEEGLLKEVTCGFTFVGAHQPFAGSGIVVGTNVRTGDSAAAKSDLIDIASKVEFFKR